MTKSVIKRLMIVGGVLLLSAGAAAAQTPSAEAMGEARKLVTTLKLSDQYRALLPAILLGLKPALVQDRPEIERDYNALTPVIVDTYTPFYTAMINAAATVYASNFSVEELRQLEAFYRGPVGQKLLAKQQALRQQVDQVGQETSRKATEELRAKLSELLRQKGHKL